MNNAINNTYVIGDIQGCYDELMALLSKIHFDEKKDRLICLGDLVNRGPKSLQVLRLLFRLENPPVILLGNHDLHLLAVHAGSNKYREGKDSFADVLDAADSDALCGWLRQQSLLYFDKEHLFVHAGISPLWNIDAALKYADEVTQILQGTNYKELFATMYGDTPDRWSDDLTGWPRIRFIINTFTRMRFCEADGRIDLKHKQAAAKDASHLLPWFQLQPKIKNKIIFGHWAALEGITNNPQFIALDTGCVWGGHLTAMRLQDYQLFSVPAGSK